MQRLLGDPENPLGLIIVLILLLWVLYPYVIKFLKEDWATKLNTLYGLTLGLSFIVLFSLTLGFLVWKFSH